MTGDKVTKENMCYGHLTDLEMALKVRMLMRTDLGHEGVCTGARDRIMYLSQKVEALEKELAALKGEPQPVKFAVGSILMEVNTCKLFMVDGVPDDTVTTYLIHAGVGARYADATKLVLPRATIEGEGYVLHSVSEEAFEKNLSEEAALRALIAKDAAIKGRDCVTVKPS